MLVARVGRDVVEGERVLGDQVGVSEGHGLGEARGAGAEEEHGGGGGVGGGGGGGGGRGRGGGRMETVPVLRAVLEECAPGRVRGGAGLGGSGEWDVVVENQDARLMDVLLSE